MKALLSGEAAKIILIGKPSMLYEANSSLATAINQAEMHLHFSGCSDVETLEVKSPKHAQAIVQEAWACDRALRLFLFLLDPSESMEDLVEYSECVEELIASETVRDFVSNRMMSRHLKHLVEVNKIFSATAGTPLVRGVFEQVIGAQEGIGLAADAFDNVNSITFGGSEEKSKCRNALIKDGTFRNIAIALTKAADISFLRLQVMSRHRQYSEALSTWTAMLQKGFTKTPAVQQVDAADEDNDDRVHIDRQADRWQPGRGRAALENVLAQRHQVVGMLKLGQIIKARELVNDLVLEQQSSSKPEHIAKTLDALAQEAKDLGATELQLEWSERAYRVNPSDPLTSGHHADALIGAGRFVDAEEAIARTEELGNRAFASNMRARLLRLKGRYEDAREIYLATAETHDDDPEVWRSYVGATECLRDLNRLVEATKEYDLLAKRWPSNAQVRTGLASTLVEAGNFTLAIKYYGIAIKNGGGVVPKIGRAAAYKLEGNYDEAIKLFDECAIDAPNNEAVFCGRAETYRAKGDPEEALRAFDLAIERAPFSVQAIIGKAETLAELKRFSETEETYKHGLKAFPEEEAFQIGLARLMRKTRSVPDALLAFDRLQKELPDNRWIAFNRADILRRAGELDAAILAFDMLLERWPSFEPAVNSRISSLIDAGRLDEARKHLVLETPLSALDWRRIMLQSLIVKAEGDYDGALKILTDAVKRVPFAKERKLIKAALASFHMEKGRYQTAARIVEDSTSPINNVISLHAFSVSVYNKQRKRARELYSDLMSRDLDGEIIELGQEIVRRFGIVPQIPTRTLAWISSAEQTLLLREIA